MTLLGALVWLGTLTFAATGALVAVRLRFDLLGVSVLAAVTAIGGGSIRDVLVGRLPPAALQNERLLWGIALVAVLVFYLHRFLHAEGRLLYALDTLGLALFAALGAERGLSSGLGMWGVIFAGAVSGVGGGVLRDLLTGQVPGILYRSGALYASAAAVGALVVFGLYRVDTDVALVAGVLTTLTLRLGSRWLGLKLPVPRTSEGS
jgi:uncharacterized membrane protein YeiH